MFIFYILDMLRARLQRKSKTVANNSLFGAAVQQHGEVLLIPDGELSDVEIDNDDIALPEANNLNGSDSNNFEVVDLDHEENEIYNQVLQQDNFRWRNRDPLPVNTHFDLPIPIPPEVQSPYLYFKTFFSDEVFEHIKLQSNIYSVEKSGKSADIAISELEQFISILLYSTLMKSADFRMYWNNHLRWPIIADIMPVKRFETIKQYFHLCDNGLIKKKHEDGYDPLFKVRYLVDHIRKCCQTLVPTQNQSIDEMMVPFKGRLQIKQYMPKKPTKWGIKIFARCSTNGMVHDFIVYTGSYTEVIEPKAHLTITGNIVRSLVLSLPKVDNFLVYFDNYFTSFDLMKQLKTELKIHTIGTIRQNRLKGCQLKSEKELKQDGRGSFDKRVDLNSNLKVVRWLDNGAVTLASTFSFVEPLGTTKRWSSSEKKPVDVPCPKIVSDYNKSMGGVDLMDMLLNLYLIDRKSTKWYMRIVYHLIGISVVNSWLQYRRDVSLLFGEKEKYMPLKDFILSIAESLAKANKSINESMKRTSSVLSSPPIIASSTSSTTSSTTQVMPQSDIRFDGFSHWPKHSGKRMRCKNENCVGTTRFYCGKCNVSLCLNDSKNCFFEFHVPK